MCTLTPKPPRAFSVLDPSHVTLTCYVLQGCSALKGGPPRKRAAFTSGRKQSAIRRGVCVCLCVCGYMGVGEGGQEAVFQGMELHYKSLTWRSTEYSSESVFKRAALLSAWDGKSLIRATWVFSTWLTLDISTFIDMLRWALALISSLLLYPFPSSSPFLSPHPH